jgi:hypothetical protein
MSVRGFTLVGVMALCALVGALFAAGAAAALPDGRGYELVSGVGEPGEVFPPRGPKVNLNPRQDVVSELPFRASADGNAVAYIGDAGEVGGDGLTAAGTGNQLLSVRDPQQRRWAVSDVTPPPVAETGVSSGITFYSAFSGDLSVGVLQGPAHGLASIGADGPTGCSVLYSRTGASYRALFTETQTPGFCGEEPELITSNPTEQALEFAGGNAGTAGVAEYSQLLFQTPAPLIAGSELSPEGAGNNLYDSADGQLRLLNVLPGGERDPNAVFGGPPGVRRGNADFSNAISADGSQVFWTDLATHGLYVRENPFSSSAATVQLDATEGPGPSGGGLFWTATPDGSKVFFTDCSQLTKNATAVSTGGCERESVEEGNFALKHRLLMGNDLYEYNFDATEGKRLTDLTADPSAGPLHADVQGVVGASQDGSYVYFVAGGALAPGAEPRTCREPEEEEQEKRAKEEPISEQEKLRLQGEERQERIGHLPAGRGCNVYLEHTGEPLRLIATLAAEDNHLERITGPATLRLGAWQPELGSRTAEVTSSGRELVFESTQQLTGYDNSLLVEEGGEASDERGGEVFVYDAAAGATGRLVCASCDPSNAVPSPEVLGTSTVGGGTYLPVSMIATSMRRWISEDGSRVFFDTSQPLVSQDTNGRQDVYEWEREGTPGCPSATSHWGGCVFLLSDGSSPDNSYFIDADTTGDSVFFIHRGGLGQAVSAEGKVNVFDARVGGGFPQTSLACAGAACQGVPNAAPMFGTPASATIGGTGNFPSPARMAGKPRPKQKPTSCKRGLTRKHKKCVRVRTRTRKSSLNRKRRG